LRLLFDLESNGLLEDATRIHGVALVNVDHPEDRADFLPGNTSYLNWLSDADTLIGHNIQRFDLPLLKKLHGFETKACIIDTMICGRLIYPNVKDTDTALVVSGKMPPGKGVQGKHSLEAWGYRLGLHKGDYAKVKEAEALSKGITDPAAIVRYVWGEWNPEMQDYLLQDVETNLALWNHLKVDQYSQAAIELEHRIARVCDEMEKAGVPFNEKAAHELHAELIRKRDEIEQQLVKTFGTWEAPISPDPSKCVFIPKRDNAKLGYKAGVPVHKTKLVTFNPRSRDHITKVLKDRGWVPEKMTEGGKPQIDEETVASIVAKYPEMQGLGEYLMLEKRLDQLADGKQAWLKCVGPDGRIHGVINPMGTTTSRAAHHSPNLGQVPNMASPYGRECRSLFYAPPGWKIVGADQQGLELRGLAHYLAPLDGGKYASIVLEGDPHWLHAQVMGLADGDRDKHDPLHIIIREDGSKRFIYAYIYGCWDAKAGEIIYTCVNKGRLLGTTAGQAVFDRFFKTMDPTKRQLIAAGKEVRDNFATRIEGFATLKNKIGRCVDKNNAIPGLDGRVIPIRSEHSALNFMIQSAGAIICKRWVCDAFDAMSQRFRYDSVNPWNGDFVFCLWVHDEIQVWVREGLEEETAQILKDCAAKAGIPYNFRVRLDGEAQIGSTWADTH
jgi:DNA polymerase I-like protein with 3'-5' exonuclease and polymerase domains